MSGSLNDLNVLLHSTLLHDALAGRSPKTSYVVNGSMYNRIYWLLDGIYPEHACFVKTYPKPSNPKQKLFASKQEAKRKEVKHAFGILQSCWHMITWPCKLWSRNAIQNVLSTVVIFHNMIIDHQAVHGASNTYVNDSILPAKELLTVEESNPIVAPTDNKRREELACLQSRAMHVALKTDLMFHIWNKFGNGNA